VGAQTFSARTSISVSSLTAWLLGALKSRGQEQKSKPSNFVKAKLQSDRLFLDFLETLSYDSGRSVPVNEALELSSDFLQIQLFIHGRNSRQARGFCGWIG